MEKNGFFITCVCNFILTQNSMHVFDKSFQSKILNIYKIQNSKKTTQKFVKFNIQLLLQENALSFFQQKICLFTKRKHSETFYTKKNQKEKRIGFAMALFYFFLKQMSQTLLHINGCHLFSTLLQGKITKKIPFCKYFLLSLKK